jgi:protein kinase C substrate 80K-H
VFYCPNEGHRPELLLSSRVNDGLCDCCDGSDEFNGLTTCSNTCDQAGQQALIAAKAAHELRTQGYQRRLELEASGKAQHQVGEGGSMLLVHCVYAGCILYVCLL